MRRISLITYVCLSVAALVYAQWTNIEVRPTGKELIETEPRNIVTTAFRITNSTSQTREFISEVKLPEGWSLITKDFPFELESNVSDTRLVSFFVPQATLAGKYEITYLVTDREYPSVRDFYTIYVVVPPVIKLEAKLLDAPDSVIAGKNYRASFVIANQSNVENSIRIKVNSGDNLPFIIDTDTFKLAPGESKKVNVTVRTDTEITEIMKHRLQLTVEVVEDSQTKAMASPASLVEILPRVSGRQDNFHRIPTEVTLSYVSEKNEQNTSGFQTEVSGEGTLDEEGKKHIKFRFRGPDVMDKSIFGLRDEYTLDYWTEDYALGLGDRYYCLSWLTENYLYGRGLEGKLNVNDEFSLGAYHMKTRWRQPGTEETGAFMDYLINDKYKVGLNYLRKCRDGKVSNITSVEGELKPFDNTQIDLEYALGPGGSGKDNAYLAHLYGRNNWLNYYLKLHHAGPDYPGYYSDLDYISAGLTVPINKYLRLNANFRRQEDNLDSDPSLHSAPLEKYYQLGLDYKMETNTTFSFDWRSRDRCDRLDSPAFDYQEDTFRFGIGQSFEKLTLHASAELGETENELDDSTSNSERYTASAYFRPTKKQYYSGYVYYDKNSDFTGESRRSTTVGVNARYEIANKTSVNLNFQTNDYQGLSHGDRDNLELRLNHTFANDHQLSVVVRHTRYRNSHIEDDTALAVQYVIPLGLPVARKKSVGSVKGYVYDEETRKPISDCLLRLNGLTAVTDKAGNFTFPSVSRGVYSLSVDTASIGMNRIPSQKTPIELVVRGGEETPVLIPVTRAAQLSGKVMVYDYKRSHNKIASGDKNIGTDERSYIVGKDSSYGEGDKLVEDRGLANTVIELRNSSEVRRIVTDNQGCFEFDQVRPGGWTLKIDSDNLPEYYYFEKGIFELELKPGQKMEIFTKVLPKKRRIRIIAEPQTLFEELH